MLHNVSPDTSRGYRHRNGNQTQQKPEDKQQTAGSAETRRGIATDSPNRRSIFNPIFAQLPDVSALKGLLATTESPHAPSAASSSVINAVWQNVDVDGSEVQMLLVSSKSHPLQIFRFHPSSLSKDLHVQERFTAPEKVFDLHVIRDDKETKQSRPEGVAEHCGEGFEPEEVIQAMLLDRSMKTVAILTRQLHRDASRSVVSLILVDLASCRVSRRAVLGCGTTAHLSCSTRAVVISLGMPSPILYVLDPVNLAPLMPSIQPQFQGTPVFDVCGRLLAYATSEPPASTGPSGLGSIITARSFSMHEDATTVNTSQAHSAMSPSDTQGALIASAVEIGGGMAKGVWAGLKMGAQAAQRARNGRLAAASAPADTSVAGTIMGGDAETSTDSSETSSLAEENSTSDLLHAGIWVKVIDLGGARAIPRVVAHFRPPTGRTPAIPDNPAGSSLKHLPVTVLSFNPFGTQLLVAPLGGRVTHIVDMHPCGIGRSHEPGDGQVWHLYELKRGNTAAVIQDVKWSSDSRWISLGSERGTTHVYPINQFGGPASGATHMGEFGSNSDALHPLSCAVHAITRLRPRSGTGDSQAHQSRNLTAFTAPRSHPFLPAALLQDVIIFRQALGECELVRLQVREAKASPPAPATAHRRMSALTEMLRIKAFGQTPDLEIESEVKTIWNLPLGQGQHPPLAYERHRDQERRTAKSSSLAKAEIGTMSVQPRILPSAIYHSHQMDFYTARPIDEYAPLSILDLEARTHRLDFQPQIKARPTSPEVKSFDEPLLSAMHSVIENPPSSQVIPRLPNGMPAKSAWKTSIPIRQVAAGLGEGVDRMRREYVRAQHKREKRRASEAANNALSFEEDAIFASSMDEVASSPSSGVQPHTCPDEALLGHHPIEDDVAWEENWEDEYARAVEDDGGPEDLVLGVMDELEVEPVAQPTYANARTGRKRSQGKK